MTSQRPIYTSQPPICLHRNAVRVASVLDQDEVWHCWCLDCDPDGKTPLPASFRFSCCGGAPGNLPGTGHLYNCAGKAPRPSPQPRVTQPAQKPATVRLAPRRRPAVRRWAVSALFAAAATGIIIAALNIPPSGPEPYSTADAAVCATWANQGATVPGGNGGAYIGDSTDPGYAQLTDAENALYAAITPDVNTTLTGLIENWMADAESSYNIVHGDWSWENFGSDRDGITAWCKANKYTQ